MTVNINTAPAATNRKKSPNLAVRSSARRLLGGRWWLAGLCLVALGSTGCVSRRLMVNSTPPGAMVLMEGREIGYTPTAVDFTYYGTREVTLIKDGYGTTTKLVPVRAPWYQWPGIDFFSDNLLPFRVTDRQTVAFDLQPQQMVPNQELINRGQMLRNEAQIPR